MAVKSDRLPRVKIPFTRVLMLAYLLVGKPSSSFVLPDECKDLAGTVLGIGGDYIKNTKDWTKLLLCLKMFFKQNPRLFDYWSNILKTDPTKAGPFIALIISIYLTKEAFDLYFDKLPKHLEFIKEHRESLRILHRDKIEPLLQDVHEVHENWQDFQLEKICDLLMARLKEIRETLSDLLLKLKTEKLEVKKTKGNAIFYGIVLGTVVVIVPVMALVLPVSAAAKFAICGAAVGVGYIGVHAFYNVSLESKEMERELNGLQNAAYEYKGKIVAGESLIIRILMKSYALNGKLKGLYSGLSA